MTVNMFLCYLLRTLNTIIIWFMPTLLFRSRFPKWYVIAGFVLVGQPLIFIKMMYMDINNDTLVISGLFAFAMYPAYFLGFLRGRLGLRAIALALFMALECVCDVLAHLIVTTFINVPEEFSWNHPARLLSIVIFLFVYPCAASALVWIWKKTMGIFKKEDMPRGIWNKKYVGLYVIFLLFFCCQTLFAVFREANLVMSGEGVTTLELIGLTLGVFDCFLGIALMADGARTMEKEKILKEFKIVQENEKKRYQMIRQEVDDIAKLRHDYQNHLTTITSLMSHESGQTDRLLENLMQSLAKYEQMDEKTG